MSQIYEACLLLACVAVLPEIGHRSCVCVCVCVCVLHGACVMSLCVHALLASHHEREKERQTHRQTHSQRSGITHLSCQRQRDISLSEIQIHIDTYMHSCRQEIIGPSLCLFHFFFHMICTYMYTYVIRITYTVQACFSTLPGQC